MTKDRFSRIVFLVAGIRGITVLASEFLSEKILAEKMPPAITHPEFFYGFFGVGIAWQVAFLIISRRSAALPPYHSRGHSGKADLFRRVRSAVCAGPHSLIVTLGGVGDFVLGAFFTISYFKLKPGPPERYQETNFAYSH